MTTIAYRDGILAGDGRVTEGELVITDNAEKVFRLPDGALYGFCGDHEDGLALYEAMRAGEKLDPSDMDLNALLIKPEGSIWLLQKSRWTREPLPYISIGSGSTAAFAAMDAGADAMKAVRIAAKRITSSGGRVRSVKLKRIK